MILLIIAVLCLLMAFRWFRFTVCNLFYIATHPFKVKAGRKRLNGFTDYVGCLGALESWIEDMFAYRSDVIDYADWPLVFAMKRWSGDCDAVASLAWYWAGKNNLHASYVSIIRPNHQPGHAVCLIKIGGVWNMVDSTGVVPFMGWPVHYPNCKIIIRKTR